MSAVQEKQNIPQRWERVKLAEICIVDWGNTDLTKKAYVPNGKYLALSATGPDGRIDHAEHKKDTPVLSAIGANCGRMFSPSEDFTAIKNTITFDAIKGKSSPKYLYYLLSSSNIPKRGGAQPFISKGDLQNLKVLIPRKESEQKKIAEILVTVDEDIAKTQEVIETTEKLKAGLMQQLFTRGIEHTKFKETDSGQIPREWTVSTTEDLLIDQKGAIKIGPFGSQLKNIFFVPVGYKVYGQENVFLNNFSAGDHFINEERFSLLKSCELHAGDFVISMMGTIGKCSIVPSGIQKGIMDSHLLRLKIDETKFDKLFILHFFTSPNLQRQIKSLSVGGIMAGLSSKVIKRLLYPTPSLPEQKQIAEILSAVDDKISVNKKLKAKLILLKKGLMQDLLSGKVRVDTKI